MGLKFKNNAATTLAALVASTDLSLTVNSTLGAVFPVLAGGDYFYCTLQSLTTPSTIEVVKVTAVAGNTFTIVRAQDGTTAQNFSVGDRVELRLVAAVLNDIPKLDEANTFQLAITLLQSMTVAGLITAQAGLLASQGVTFNDGSRLSTTSQLSFRNRAHNGNFAVNQRMITSPTTLAAGVTGFDRWKAGPGGCTFSFVASGNGNIITITAGTLIHVVEDLNIEGGNYAISHQGTAQVRTGINGAVPSGAYANATTAAPVASGVATAKQTLSVEFGLGTVDRVQIEPGAAASPFERRPYSMELGLCQRYLPCWPVGENVNERVGLGFAISGTTALIVMIYPAPTRISPTGLVVSSPGDFTLNNGIGSSNTCGSLAFNAAGKTQMTVIAGAGVTFTAGQGASLSGSVVGSGKFIYATGAEL